MLAEAAALFHPERNTIRRFVSDQPDGEDRQAGVMLRLTEQKQRVWEIDAWRGFLILAVLINHLNMTVNKFCINGYYNMDSAVWASASDPLGVWYYYDVDGILRSAKWVTWLREHCTNPAVDTFLSSPGFPACSAATT